MKTVLAHWQNTLLFDCVNHIEKNCIEKSNCIQKKMNKLKLIPSWFISNHFRLMAVSNSTSKKHEKPQLQKGGP